jgi:hypothetical protein
VTKIQTFIALALGQAPELSGCEWTGQGLDGTSEPDGSSENNFEKKLNRKL